MTDINHSDLVNRLRIIQNMRSILIQPPTDELRRLVADQLVTETNPDMKAFLNLMVTDNQGNREIAATVFKSMADRLISDEQTGVSNLNVSVDAPSVVPAPVLDEPLPVMPLSPEGAAKAIKSMEEAASSIEAPTVVAPTQAAVATIEAATVVPVTAPFYKQADNLESVGWALTLPGQNEPLPSKTYTIIRSNAPEDVLDSVTLTHLTGLIFGIQGQPNISQGFGFVCPLTEKLFSVPKVSDPRCTLKIKLELPNVLPVWDEHALIGSEVAAYYHTAYQLMAKGYHFLVDLEIIPYKNSFICSMSPDIRIEHKEGLVRVGDLNALQFAASKLMFAGFTAEAIYRD